MYICMYVPLFQFLLECVRRIGSIKYRNLNNHIYLFTLHTLNKNKTTIKGLVYLKKSVIFFCFKQFTVSKSIWFSMTIREENTLSFMLLHCFINDRTVVKALFASLIDTLVDEVCGSSLKSSSLSLSMQLFTDSNISSSVNVPAVTTSSSQVTKSSKVMFDPDMCVFYSSGTLLSSSSMISWGSEEKPQVLKQFFTARGVTFRQALSTILIAWRTLIEEIVFCSISAIIFLTTSFLYNVLKFLILPWSKGWSRDVVWWKKLYFDCL